MSNKLIDIQSFLDQDQKKDLLRLLTAGSVDNGKSTLIGRLMFDSKMLYEDQLATLERDSKRIGHAGEEIDYALLLDGLKAEREQGITIDVAYRYFSTAKRKFIIADTPGHEQYTRNMITGGSTASLAIILIDATKGVITQTRRHTFLVSLLGIKHIVLAVNKMDLVHYKKDIFNKICLDYKDFIAQLDLPKVEFIPLSALKGDNVVDISDNMPWYNGKSLLEYLETVQISSDRNYDDFRFPVQYVLRPDRNFRGFSGKIASGIVKPGDTVMALPSQKITKVKEIPTYDGNLEMAFPPQAVTLVLEDEIDISRGEMLVAPDNLPFINRHFEATLVWMDEQQMDRSIQFYIKQASSFTRAKIDQLKYKVDVNTLVKSEVERLELNEIGRAVITTAKPLLFDPYKINKNTGSFILIDPVTHNTVAVGMIVDKIDDVKFNSEISDKDKKRIKEGKSLVSTQSREKQLNQKGVTLWFTGLHGSGKNELAYALEKRLFEEGATTVLLDENLIGLNNGGNDECPSVDCKEDLQRAAHMAKILNDQGIIVICSFISGNDSTRRQIEEIIGRENFHLFYMKASIDYCRENKPGLYEMADRGEIDSIPGVDLKYDEPANARLIFNPLKNSENCFEIVDYLQNNRIYPLE